MISDVPLERPNIGDVVETLETATEKYVWPFPCGWRSTVPWRQYAPHAVAADCDPDAHPLLSRLVAPRRGSLHSCVWLHNTQAGWALWRYCELWRHRRSQGGKFTARWRSDSTDTQLLKQRQLVYAAAMKHQSAVSQYEQPPGGGITTLLAFHVTTEVAAKAIATSGFANLCTTDDGYFGKGIYFTPSIEYALDVYGPELRRQYPGGDAIVVLACWLCCGNIYPCTKLMSGVPNETGYDTHVAVVYQQSGAHCPPATLAAMLSPTPAVPQYVEVVVFDVAQALPVALMKCNV